MAPNDVSSSRSAIPKPPARGVDEPPDRHSGFANKREDPTRGLSPFAALRHSLSFRLLGRVLLFSACVTLILTLLQLYIQYRQDVSALEFQLDQIGKTNLDSLAERLWALDENQLRLQLAGILRHPGVHAVEVREAGKEHDAMDVKLGERSTSPLIIREFPLLYDIRGQNTRIGTLYVEAALDDIHRKLFGTAWSILMNQAAETFLVALFIVYIFHNLVTRHLSAVASYVDNYRIGDSPMPLELRRPTRRHEDELQRVVTAFNALSDNLQDAYGSLREQEGRVRRLIDANIIGIFVWEQEGRILEANEAFLHIIGYDRDDLVSGRVSWKDLTPPEWLDVDTQERIPELKSTGSLQPFEKEYFRKDGTRIPVLIGVAAFDEASSQGVAFVLDLTERKRAEVARREIEEQWKAAFESNPTMYFIIDEARVILSVNAYGADQLGYTAGELVGQPVLSVFYEPDRGAVHEHASACFEKPGAMMRWEARKIRKDGTVLWVRETGNAVFLKNRLVLLVVCEDITEQRLAEDAARRSERELRDAIENIPAMVFTALPGPSNVFASRGWREYTGLSSQDTAGSGWQAALHLEDTERFMEKWRVSSAAGEPFEDEARFRRAVDGEYQWFLVRAVALRDERGNIRKWYGVLTDIEDRKRAEEALRSTAKELRDLIETMPSLAFSTWPDGSGEFTTGRWREYSGLSTEETFGERGASTIHPNDRDQHFSKWRASLASGEPFENEARHRSAKGEYRWFLVRAVPLRNEHGNILKWYGTLTDIEDRKRAEDALRRSESYLSEAQRLSHTGSWARNAATGETTHSSEEHSRLFGFDPELGLPSFEEFSQHIHPEDRAKVAETFDKAIRERIDFEVDLRTIMPDHTIKSLHGVGHPVFSTAGDLIEYVGTVVDVTEQKRAEESLRRSEAYLVDAQRMSHTGSWAYSHAMDRAIYWSEETFRIFELDPQRSDPPYYDEFIRLIHPEDRDRFRENTLRCFREKLGFTQEYRLMLDDGTIKYIHEIGHPVLDASAKLVEYFGTLIDVTERRHAEEELRAAETRFRASVDHLADALFIHDDQGDQGQVIDVNQRACDSLGYTREELIGMTAYDYDQLVDAAFMLSVKERLARGEIFSFESAHRRKDGTVFPVEVRVRSFSHGDHRFGLAVVRDITDRKRSEQEHERLRQLEADLAHVNRVSTLGELAASLAHELKQPIAAAVANAKTCQRWLARDEPRVLEAREAAMRIVHDANRAAGIIDHLRSFYRKGTPPQRELVDVNEIVHEMLGLLRSEASRHAVVIRTELTAEIPNVAADRVQLQQVIMNLMLNGIEAMKDKGGRLTIKSELGQDGYLRISVSDNGVGLPVEHVDEIFSAFFTTKPQGSGMGLAISRSIVESHGGRIWATANSDRGATFQFTLPATPVPSSVSAD